MLDMLRRWWRGDAQRQRAPAAGNPAEIGGGPLKIGGAQSAMPDPAVDVLGAASLPKDARGQPVTEATVALVARFEGFRAWAYLCPAGVPTIGYGATFYPGGRRVTLNDPSVTEASAREMLRRHLRDFAAEVDGLVTVPLTEGERGALISFAFNVGLGAFRDSTLLRRLNAGDRDGASGQFARWNQAGGKVLPGLVARRVAEAAMFRGVAL